MQKAGEPLSERYSRQELFAPIGPEGQGKLRSACVAIVGCGALGSLQAETLVRAGIGRLILVDRDFVEASNLHRQSLFTEEDAQQSLPKAIAAAHRLQSINSDVPIEPHVADLSIDTLTLLSDAQLILDGTDNFQTRYLINDFSWKQNIPWIYGACVASTGVAAAFVPPDFPCLRCLFENEPAPGSAQTCDTAGIIWPAVGAVVSYQMSAALKLLTGGALQPKLYQTDVWEDHHHVVSLAKAKRAECATCGLRTFPSLHARSGHETALCGRDAVQIKPQQTAHLNLDEICIRWQKVGETVRNPFLAKLKIQHAEIVLFPDGRALIKGTQDLVRARDLYAKYVGT